jgi:hypothetical protein
MQGRSIGDAMNAGRTYEETRYTGNKYFQEVMDRLSCILIYFTLSDCCCTRCVAI